MTSSQTELKRHVWKFYPAKKPGGHMGEVASYPSWKCQGCGVEIRAEVSDTQWAQVKGPPSLNNKKILPDCDEELVRRLQES